MQLDFVFMLFAYLCLVMERELGKWLMDIAKYTMTAVILTSILENFHRNGLSMQEVH